MSEERKWIVEREVPTVTKDGDKHILMMKSTIDECALKWTASEDAAIRASLVKLGWTPPESAALHTAEREVLEAALAYEPLEITCKSKSHAALLAAVRRYRALIDAESK